METSLELCAVLGRKPAHSFGAVLVSIALAGEDGSAHVATRGIQAQLLAKVAPVVFDA